MTKATTVTIGFLLSTPIRDRDSGRRFLELLLDVAPMYAPEKYDRFEPVRRVFDRTNLDEVLESWGSSFLWRRSKPTIQGSAWMGGHNSHDAVLLWVPPKTFRQEIMEALFARMHAAFGVVLGYVHVGTDADMVDREAYKACLMPLAQGLSTFDLRGGLPTMPWAALFGPPYVALFGRDRLLSARAEHVRRMGDAVYVQLTPNAGDVASHRDEYLLRQEAVKQHLGRNAFRDSRGSGASRVPAF